MSMRIGVDLGGTKIEAIALAADGSVRMRRRVPTPKTDQPAIVSAIAELISAMEAELDIRATVGVGLAGAVSADGVIVRAPNIVLAPGAGFGDALALALARPIRLANDGNCFALSEAADGAGAGAE